MMRFVLLDESAGAKTSNGESMTPEVLANIAAACTVQLNRDFSTEWGGNYEVRAGSGAGDIQPGEIVFALLPTLSGAPGAIAYHDSDGNGVPVLFDAITLSTSIVGPGNSVSVAISHELCETAGDEGCNDWCDDGTGNSFAKEMCLAPDTIVVLANGETETIARLAQRGGFFDVTSSDASGRSVSARAGHARLTARSADVVKVHLHDGSSFTCTPNHKIMLLEGSFVPAGSLEPGTRLRGYDAPRASGPRPVDSGHVDAESIGQRTGSLQAVSDLDHLVHGELRNTDILASQARPPHAALDGRVDHVVPVGTKEEVTGSHAEGHVATVTHLDAFRDLPKVHFVRQAVGEDCFPAPDLPVASIVGRASPEPALVRFSYSGPESVGQGGRATVIGGMSGVHGSMSSYSGPVGGAEALRAERPKTSGDGAVAHAKVVRTVEPSGKSDVYDLTAPAHRNFAIGAGVFVHNCDAVESNDYAINGVHVSDFLLKSFFVPGRKGPYDFMASAGFGGTGPAGPFATAAGGYQIARTMGTGDHQVWASAVSRRAEKRRHESSRTYRRGARV